MSSWLEAIYNFFTAREYNPPVQENTESYIPTKHIFTVETSEGEVCGIDTADSSSRFYGDTWTKILTAYEKKDFVRGRAITRSVSRDNRFSGYAVDIEGVEAFLPASKSSWFYNPERDACGKYIALSIESIYTSGKTAGKLIVNAYEPVRFLTARQNRKNYLTGGMPYAIAMDYDNSFLIFPFYKEHAIYVPINEAAAFAQSRGIRRNPEELTGWCWQLRISDRKYNQCLAYPVDILTD